MDFAVSPQNLALAIAICGVAASLFLALLALARSRTALRAAIPAPEVQPAYRDFIIVRMRAVEDKRFGISALRARGGGFSALSDFSLRDLEGALRGNGAMYRFTTSEHYTPPAVSVLIRSSLEAQGSVWAQISCRDDSSLSRWVRLI